jgi:hypothetical protein
MRSFTRTLRETRGGPLPRRKDAARFGKPEAAQPRVVAKQSKPGHIHGGGRWQAPRGRRTLCVGCTKAAQAPVLSRPSRGDQPGARASARLRSRHGHCG